MCDCEGQRDDTLLSMLLECPYNSSNEKKNLYEFFFYFLYIYIYIFITQARVLS